MEEENLTEGAEEPGESTTPQPPQPTPKIPSPEPLENQQQDCNGGGNQTAPMPPAEEVQPAVDPPPADPSVEAEVALEPASVAAFAGMAEAEPATESVTEEIPPEEETQPGTPIRGFIAEWVVTIIMLLFGTTNLVQAFVIPTGSMEDTLLVGDHLLVDKLAFSPARGIEKTLLPYQDVKRGDIIVFRYPMDIQQTFVKRCIGVPGDRIHLVDKQLWLNGKPMQEPYVYHKTEYIDSYRDNFPSEPNVHLKAGGYDMLERHVQNGDVVVPPGYYFAMGDNRDWSSDSRYWGFVPRGNIIGKPLVIYWSYDAPTDALTGTFSVDHLLDMVLHFPTKTRWSRTFRFIHGYPLK